MYPWLLFAHIVSVAGFLLAHGTSAAMAFRLRQEKTTDGIRSLPELSKQTTNMMYGFVLLILITGLFLGSRVGGGAGLDLDRASDIDRHDRGDERPWPALQRGSGSGRPPVRAGRRITTSPPGSPEELRRALVAAAPGLITTVGVVALALLLWLMILKPF